MSSFRTSLQVRFQNILFATDFSATADRALPYAIEIARRSVATIHAVYVISPDGSPFAPPEEWAEIARDQEEFLEREKKRLELELQELPHEFLTLSGAVWENLERVIRDKNVDLLVLGTHGRTGIAKALLGSVAEKIFRQATCPVLTVGPGVAPRAAHAAAAELNCILYATDFSPESLAAARCAISLAKDHRAQLILLHTEEDGMKGQEDLALETLKNVVPLGACLASEPNYLVERGPAADAILRAAKKAHADLIVLGARGSEKHLVLATHFSDSIASSV
ncbi:MAG TPA: universal stress protein, partial [Candidatus Methylomirabilis sp.]|nr:universal stress protein [Candidatus Methylomirabilis sp.]